MSEVRFGSYRITGTIGTGALATIYQAVQEPLGRVVALKALKTQITSTSSFGEQIDREAKILADLVHPNVVLLLESGRATSGRPFIALEYIDGPSLHDVLVAIEKDVRRKKKLSLAGGLAIACGICAALEHVHHRGVVHKDIKPGNVLLSRSGVVKVIDFGIAQRPRTTSMSDALGAEMITASGRMAPDQMKDAFGTPAYMSPEQILGDFVDGRSDLFSLGVVLYQMLSGSRPFDAPAKTDERRTAQRIRRDAPAPLRERAPHCPRSLERIVMRLLEKSPNERYPSASAVRERLEGALRAETRTDPTLLVRHALADTGFAERPSEADVPDSASRPAVSARRAAAGLAGIGVFFAVGVIGIEALSPRGARDAVRPGSRGLELVPDRAGGLRVLATPWAYVKVDGQLVETTPFARAIPLSAGTHYVTLSHPDAPSPVERTIEVTASEITTLDVTLDVTSDDAGRDAR